MKLIVGLGNPGIEYNDTRHNVGFSFLDYYLTDKNYTVNWVKKFEGLYYEVFIKSEKVIFLKPQTFMNLSGLSVKKFVDYFNINLDDIFIISDDLDLNLGNFKLKLNGSSGGHNGLKSIETSLGSNSYKRLKIGISNNKLLDTKNYVLGKFSKTEKEILNDLFKNLVPVLDDYFNINFNDLMSRYNKKNR